MTDIKEYTEKNTDTDVFSSGDFVFTKSGSEFIGGGYKINSIFLEDEIPIMTTYNDFDQNGGNVSSPFENLAVPAGLFYINTRVSKKEYKTTYNDHFNHHKTAPDEIMDKLFSLVEFDKKQKRKTKKNNSKQNKKNTRKRK